MSQVNINLNTNQVEINTTNNQISVTNPDNPSVVNITQPVTNVIEVITSGPQGPQGMPGPIPDTGSFVTTGSFNAFTSSYNTGSFSGSFTGNLVGSASFASTASFAQSGNGSFSGSFSGSGANLSGIPASGIVGLNLSQIATGSVTASVSPTQFSVTSGSSTELVVTGTGITIGSVITDTHRVTGSLNISGSVTATNFTGSLFGTASWANNAISASFAVSSSRSVSSSFSTSASFAQTSSIVQSIANNITNNVDNYVLTVTGENNINGEANLTFDGSLLKIQGTLEQGSSDVDAQSEGSHAEGRRTITLGVYSHAEGRDTETGIQTAFSTDKAEVVDGLVILAGYDATAYFTPGGYLYLYDENLNSGWTSHLIDTVNFEGDSTLIQLLDTTVNANLALVGDLTYLQNNGTFGGDNNLPGPYAHSEGFETKAMGQYSHAEGASSYALGQYSHAEGRDTQAIGQYSHTEGGGSRAVGDYSHAEGQSTQAIGASSHTEGTLTKTGTQTAFITKQEGGISSGLVILANSYGDVTANFTPGGYLYLYDEPFDGNYGRAIYQIDTVSFDGDKTVIQLVNTEVSTNIALVGDLTYLQNNGTFGGNQIIPTPFAHTEGDGTLALGESSHAEGMGTKAVGYRSHAEGFNTMAIGESSHAEGNFTQAIGNYSHAEGDSSLAEANHSHAEGISTIARGYASHTEGEGTIARGQASHAEGLATIAIGAYQHVQGQFNRESSIQSAFIVGNGIDGDNRSNLIFAAGNTVQVTGSVIATQGFTGSLFGTSSWSNNAISSSFAATASFAPAYLPLTGGTISGSLVVQNNLTVLGSASIQYISESTLNIGTNLITVNTINPGARFGGLAVIDSGSSPQVSASFLYDSVQDEFIFVHRGTSTSAITSSHFVLGPETYNDLGNEIYLTANRIPKGTGIEHLNDSNISDNGSVVSINSNTQVTGSLTVTQGITGSLFGTASFATSSSFASTASFAPAYLPIAVPQTTGLVISFTEDRVYGTFASPETGSAITSNTASAILGVTNLIIHSASVAPTTGSDFKKLTGSSNYVAGLNYIYCTYIANNQIIYSINQAT